MSTLDMFRKVFVFVFFFTILLSGLLFAFQRELIIFLAGIMTLLSVIIGLQVAYKTTNFLSAPVNVSGILITLYIIQIVIPSFILLFENQFDKSLQTLWGAVQISLFFLILGLLFAKVIQSRSQPHRQAKEYQPNKRYYKYIRTSFILWIGVILLNIFRLHGQIPLFFLLSNKGSAAEVVLLREQSLKLLQVSRIEIYLYEYTRAFFLPVMSSIAFIVWRTEKKKWARNWFVIYFCLSVLYAGFTTAKAPVAFVFLLLSLTYAQLYGIRKFIKYAPIFLFLIFFYPVLENIMKYNTLQYGFQGFFMSLRFVLWERMLEVPVKALSLYFKYFPLSSGFLHGRSIRVLSQIIGQPYFNTANYVYIMREGSPRIMTGLANAAFLGNFYADFGWWGVTCGSFIVGFLGEWIQNLISNSKKTALSISILSFWVSLYSKLVYNPFPPLFLGGGGIIAIMIFVLDAKTQNRSIVRRQSEISTYIHARN